MYLDTQLGYYSNACCPHLSSAVKVHGKRWIVNCNLPEALWNWSFFFLIFFKIIDNMVIRGQQLQVKQTLDSESCIEGESSNRGNRWNRNIVWMKVRGWYVPMKISLYTSHGWCHLCVFAGLFVKFHDAVCVCRCTKSATQRCSPLIF